jgi:hypothetical protein
MNETQNVVSQESGVAQVGSVQLKPQKQRGRPKLNVNWPQTDFTFNSLEEDNVLSSSSLRKKMRAELNRGALLKVGTLKTAFGRPKNLYRKAS